MARTKRQPMQTTLDILNAGEGEGGDKAAEPTLADVQKQLVELQAARDEDKKTIERLTADQSALLSTSTYQAPQFLSEEVNLDNLPDPTEDLKAYNIEMAKRFKTAYGNAKQNEALQMEGARDAATQRDLLWQDFQTAYSDYAKDPQKVGIASEQVARIAKARKMDLEKYMFGAGQKRFMADVVTMHDKLFGKPIDLDKEDDDEGDDGDDNRTMGIFAGQESGGKPTPGKNEPTAQNPGGFTQAIREWQLKNGFHR